MTKVLVFWDSIAWWAFDKEQWGWVERLKTHYLNNFKEKGISIYNLSVSSNDSAGVLEFMEHDIQKITTIEPEEIILLFSIGSNDMRYFDTKENVKIPENEFCENLQKIIDLGKKYSNKIIFTGLMKVDEELSKPWCDNEYWENEDMRKYDRIIEEISDKNSLDFIPLMHLIDESLLDDWLHPNSWGHEKIFEQVKKYLEKSI